MSTAQVLVATSPAGTGTQQVRSIAVLVLALAGSVLGGCASLLGVDGTYESGEGGKGGATGQGGAGPMASVTDAATSTDAAASTGTGAGGEGGAPSGGGGSPPFVALASCEAQIAIDLPAGETDHVLGVDARAPRARILDGALSVAWDQPGAAIAFREDIGIGASLGAAVDAVPFDASPHWLAALDTVGGHLVVSSESGDVVSSNENVGHLRDAVLVGGGASFLARVTDDGGAEAWVVLAAPTLTTPTFDAVPSEPLTCAGSTSVVDAAFVEHDFGNVVAACADGKLALPFSSQAAFGFPRSVAAARSEAFTYVAVRHGEGVHLLRATADDVAPPEQLDDAPPFVGAGHEDLNRISVAVVPGGAITAWTDEARGTFAAAFCPPSGPCCALDLDRAIDDAVGSAGELAASQRAAASLASSPDGTNLALAYVHEPSSGLPLEAVAMRLIVAMP